MATYNRRDPWQHVPMRAISVRVDGLVQGVGFRYRTARVARALDLVGWVRNRSDGSVAVWAQGSVDAVDEIVAFLEVGPEGAAVSRCLVDEVATDPTFTTFEVRY